MAVKARAKVKRQPIRKSAAKRTSPRQIREWLSLYAEQCQARYRLAMDAYNAQDEGTKEILDRIRDRLVSSASGYVRLPDGTALRIENDLVGAHAMYMALEILKDMYIMGVKVGTFKMPKVHCAECGVQLGDTKAGVKRRGR